MVILRVLLPHVGGAQLHQCVRPRPGAEPEQLPGKSRRGKPQGMVKYGQHTVEEILYQLKTMRTSSLLDHPESSLTGLGESLSDFQVILWMEEILHQLKMVVYPIIYRVLTIQGGAGFRNHPQYCMKYVI